jgi:hypothetical protein
MRLLSVLVELVEHWLEQQEQMVVILPLAWLPPQRSVAVAVRLILVHLALEMVVLVVVSDMAVEQSLLAVLELLVKVLLVAEKLLVVLAVAVEQVVLVVLVLLVGLEHFQKQVVMAVLVYKIQLLAQQQGN